MWWGESYVYNILLKKFSKKYPDANIKEKEDGFDVIKGGNSIINVKWWNKNGESGSHCDIEINHSKKGKFLIEVKSTEDENRCLFDVSKEQWRLMQEFGNRFYIFRVFGAGRKRAKVMQMKNPYKMWKEGKIHAYPVRIELWIEDI